MLHITNGVLYGRSVPVYVRASDNFCATSCFYCSRCWF